MTNITYIQEYSCHGIKCILCTLYKFTKTPLLVKLLRWFNLRCMEAKRKNLNGGEVSQPSNKLIYSNKTDFLDFIILSCPHPSIHPSIHSSIHPSIHPLTCCPTIVPEQRKQKQCWNLKVSPFFTSRWLIYRNTGTHSQRFLNFF